MAYQRRGGYEKSGAQQEAPPAREEKSSRSGRSPSGSGNAGRNKGQGGDSEFVNVTGLFESKKGGSFTVFLKEDHIEILKNLQPGDLLGVTQSQKHDNIFNLWIREGKDN